MRGRALDQVPAVAKDVAHNGDGAIGFVARRLPERDASGAAHLDSKLWGGPQGPLDGL